MRRRLCAGLLCVVAAVIALMPSPQAWADADPPSDYLYGFVNDLYLPLERRTAVPERAALLKLLKQTRAKGRPYKIAVIATPFDLGAVPVFIDKPARYVKFLYSEIGFSLKPQHATLLVVMQSGMAVTGLDGTPAGRAALARLRVPEHASATTLARTAVGAARAIAAANGHPFPSASARRAADNGGGGLSWWAWALVFLGALLATRVAVVRLHRMRDRR